jgi:phospholipase/lecithinase/hemolysin
MSIRPVLFALIFLLSLQPLTAHATTPTYDAIYVFGDSYCDVGNVYIATKGADPSSPYYNGRFSNGPIWVEHVAGYMNLPMKPYLAGGTDYAFGGAEVTAPVTTAEGTIPSVPQQVALYLSQHNGKADPNALYIIEGGGNDILNANATGSPQSLAFQIALGIADSEYLLRAAGAKSFLIPNLFDVSLLPIGKPNASFNHQASLATNTSVNTLLAVEQLLEGIHITRIDIFDLLQAVVTAPSHFGFTDVTDPCINPVTSAVCPDPDHTFFWDTFHPTEFGHAFFATITEAALSQ